MIIKDFLNDIDKNCSKIVYLSMKHVYTKLYDDIENTHDSLDNLMDILLNYSLLLRYLNDYSSTIYRKYNSSVEEIYDELCKYFNLSIDNKYTFEHIIKKLEKQTPSLLMSLVDDDIKKQTIDNFIEKLVILKNSNYYKINIISLKDDIEKLENNIALVKKASNL